MTPRITAGASADLVALAVFFDARQQGLGARFNADFDALVRRLLVRPRLYAPVYRPPRGRDIRESMTSKFPVRVVYEVTAAEIVIWSVTHARARRQPWRRRI